MTNAEAKLAADAARQRREDLQTIGCVLIFIAQARATYYGIVFLLTVALPEYWLIWAGALAFVWLIWKIDNDDDSDVFAALNRVRPKRLRGDDA